MEPGGNLWRQKTQSVSQWSSGFLPSWCSWWNVMPSITPSTGAEGELKTGPFRALFAALGECVMRNT